MTQMYRQCQLQQDQRHLTTWLSDEKKYTVGSRITLKDEDGYWIIRKISDLAIDEKYMVTLRDNHRNQREASDI